MGHGSCLVYMYMIKSPIPDQQSHAAPCCQSGPLHPLLKKESMTKGSKRNRTKEINKGKVQSLGGASPPPPLLPPVLPPVGDRHHLRGSCGISAACPERGPRLTFSRLGVPFVVCGLSWVCTCAAAGRRVQQSTVRSPPSRPQWPCRSYGRSLSYVFFSYRVGCGFHRHFSTLIRHLIRGLGPIGA